MFSIAAAVMGVLLIVLERTGRLRLYNKRAACAAIVMAALTAGFYFTDTVRIVVSIGAGLLKWGEGHPGEARFFGEATKVSIVIRTILIILSTVPAAAGLIYTIQALVRKTYERAPADTDRDYAVNRISGCISRGIIASVGAVISIIAAVVCILPYMDRVIGTLIVFNPFLVLFVIICTFGLVIIPLAAFIVALNGMFMILLIGIGSTALAFYLISVIMCITAAVISAKNSIIQKKGAVAYSLFGLLPGWNIIAFVMLRKELKKTV